MSFTPTGGTAGVSPSPAIVINKPADSSCKCDPSCLTLKGGQCYGGNDGSATATYNCINNDTSKPPKNTITVNDGVCGSKCCGCLAQNGPTEEVLALTNFCALNYGSLSTAKTGPDGNTNTKWCGVGTQSGNSDNSKACSNTCEFIPNVPPPGTNTLGLVVPDNSCLIASLPLGEAVAIDKSGGSSKTFGLPTIAAPSADCEGTAISNYTEGTPGTTAEVCLIAQPQMVGAVDSAPYSLGATAPCWYNTTTTPTNADCKAK